MTMLHWLPLLIALLSPPAPKQLEINIQYSLEGITVLSDAVVCARLLDVVETRDKGGKPMNSSLLLVTHAIKGAETGDTLCFSWRSGPQHSPGVTRGAMEEGLFFLSRTPEAYGRDGHSCDAWPVRPPEGPSFEWINLSSPGAGILSASGFRRLDTEVELVNACRLAAEAEAAFRESSFGEEPVIGYLEVPDGTEAYQALYSGSACYLRVPMFMFPGAKEGF